MGFNLKSVFFCAICIFLMQGYASEFNAESLYQKLADVMFENKLLPLKLKLEEATKKIEKQAEIISKLEKETADKMEKQAERITNLEEATSKIEKQADKITKLEEETEKNLKKIENMTMGGASIEKEIQSLNNQMAQLENNSLNNEKAISKVTVMAKENKLKANNESESSVKIVQDAAKKQSVIVRKMLYAVKQSFHDKFIIFKNETKVQLSAMHTSVESQISSVKTFLNLTENNVSETLNDYSIDMNDTFSNLNREMQIFTDEFERKLESLRGDTDKVLDQYKTTLNEASGDIQELQKRMLKVEDRQGKRVAFLAKSATRQSGGIVRFFTVYLNEGSAYDSTSGIFTCQTTGLYHIAANMIEGGGGYNDIYCNIRKNDSVYVAMKFLQGSIDGKRATDGYGAATGLGTFHLMKGDRVYVYCNSDTGSSLSHSSFSGILISADP